MQPQPSQSISSKYSSSPQASNSSAQDSSVHMRMAYSMEWPMLGRPPDGMQLRALGGGHDQPDVAPCQHEHRRLPVPARPVERRQAGVEDREELLVAAVHVVGDAAAVALGREREQALHAIAVGLDDDFLLSVLHGGAM